MTLNNKNAILSSGVQFVLFSFLIHLFSVLVYKQITRPHGLYISDMRLYIRQGQDDIIIHKRMIATLYSIVYKITQSVAAIAFVQAIVVVGTAFLLFLLLKYLWSEKGVRVNHYALKLLPLVPIFAGSIYLPGIHELHYKSSWKGYALHSPTQQMMLFFAVLTVYTFLKVYKSYSAKIDLWQLFLLSVFLLLCTYSKPSFFLSFVPAVGLILIWKSFMGRKEHNIRKRLYKLLLFGSATIPALIYLFYLYVFLFGNAAERSVGIQPMDKFFEMENLLLKIILGLAFPLYVLFHNIWKRRKERDILLVVSWLNLLISYIQSIAFVDLGKESYGNFHWGLKAGVFFVFIASVYIFVYNYYDKAHWKNVKNRRRYLAIGIGFLSAHMASGVVYFILVLNGQAPYGI
jgi:hypothetical protein